MRRILVIRGGAIGDFLLTLPVLKALRSHYPGCFIEVLGHPRIASLAVAGGLAESVSPIESPALSRLFTRADAPPESVAKYFASFDLIISFLYDPERVVQSNILNMSAAFFIAGPHRPDETLGVHAVEQLLRALESIGISGADPHPRLTLPARAGPAAIPLIAAHPGSGAPQKNWPETKWGRFLGALAQDLPHKLLLIGGEAEGARCQRLAAILPPGRAVMAQDLPLVELAGEMQSCAAYIGHDSGITHLAAALDLPGAALWGPTDETTWRPKSETILVLRDPRGLAQLPVETVHAALRSCI